MPTYNKLVRDRIPEIIEKSGKDFRTRSLDSTEYDKELRTKLVEELHELLEATTKEETVEEIADVLEVLYALASIHQVDSTEIEQVRQKKHDERGGFKDRTYLIDVEDET
ncbi:nucleoside triphosphate pyrophosphohydrolase [Bacillus sp. FJAT-45037]|uniref:nucleoside triphosphate pyrophosphohydrolase n=1 Tax=Bacillus sp. FJAT-45037 TaxID=2011007 RepID=UPI000C231107|nr:nucleoside triphosphate pyrophosphohydrolase [Bacillus sp. FJAT-45037]